MRVFLLLYILTLSFAACTKAKRQSDSDLYKTDIIEQGVRDLAGEKVPSIEFSVNADEELRLEAEVICSDLNKSIKAQWVLSDKEQLTGKGISLSYLNPGVKNVQLNCIAENEKLKKIVIIKVFSSDLRPTSCLRCADVQGVACDLKLLNEEGNIWRKNEASCWQSYDGFVDLVPDTSDDETGEAVEGDWVDSDNLSEDLSDNASQNDDPDPINDGEDEYPVCSITYSDNLILNHSFEDTSKFKLMEDSSKDIIFGPKSWNLYTSEEIKHWNVRWTNKSVKASLESGLEKGVCGQSTRKGMIELQTEKTLKILVPDGKIYAKLDSDCGGPNGPKAFRGSEHTNVRVFQKIKNLLPNDEYNVSFDFRRRRISKEDKNRMVLKFSGVKFIIDINSYDKDFLADNSLISRVYNYKGKAYQLKKMSGDWYEFSAVIIPSKDKATLSLKDDGDPDSFGLLVDNFKLKHKIKSCVCSDGQSTSENSICP